MKTQRMLVVMMLAIVSVASSDEGKSTIRGGKPYFEASEVTTKHATVLTIDQKTRVISGKYENGDTVVVTVKPEVKTLGQVKVGDRIKVTTTERFTVHVESSGSPELVREEMRADAKEGEQPRVSLTERTSYKATISAIDTVKGTVTLKDVDGEEMTVTPKRRSNLTLVSVGDHVVFTSTQTRTAEIAKPKATKAPAKK